MKANFRRFAFLLSLSLLACNSGSQEEKGIVNSSLQKPNIIIVLTDDQGYKDVGFNGSTDILTPNIDSIAARGIVFSNGYVSHPYCSPSRAGLMTGKYQQRFGHEHNVPFRPNDETMGTPTDQVFLSQIMKEAGYSTCAIGKWHLGDHPKFLPHNRGFDHWFGFSGGNMNFWGFPRLKNGEMYVQRNDEKIQPKALTYLTDDFTDEALSFIKKNKKDPFFMYLAYNAPHSPDHATKRYLEKTAHIEYGTRSVYGAMIAGVDEGVGRIEALLKEMNLRDNTMIVFLSDNGGRLDAANNGQFRGHKGMLFEGGIRVPFAMSWPAKLPQGVSYNQPVSSLDLYNTCMAAAGMEASKGQQLDGVNLIPYLTGANQGVPHDVLYWRVANGAEYAVRKGAYKLIKSAYKNKTMLYNLESDPMEVTDIATENPEVFQELQTLYKEWNTELALPRWIDLHIENVEKEEANTQNTRIKSLSKAERASIQ